MLYRNVCLEHTAKPTRLRTTKCPFEIDIEIYAILTGKPRKGCISQAMFHYKTTIARTLTKLLCGAFFETFDKTKIFMSAKLKTDSRVILTKNPSRELIWSQTIMMKMMKILHFHVKTVVLNLLKKNMSYHICVPLGMLENIFRKILR